MGKFSPKLLFESTTRHGNSMRNLPSLMMALQKAKPGNGSIKNLIDSAGFEITGRVFTRLIIACRAPKQWRKAIEILDLARRRDMANSKHPHFFSYSAAISVCCKSDRLAEGLKLASDMRNDARQNSTPPPDSIVYRLLIGCCLRLGHSRQALILFSECTGEGVELDDQTLHHVLTAHISLRMWTEAGNILDKLHVRVGCLSVQQYNGFISACIADGNLDMATEVLLTMQMVGVSPDALTCHFILVALRKSRDQGVGIEFLKDAISCGIPVSLSHAKLLQGLQP